MAQPLNVIVIHGSLRKGSFNHAIARTLPKLAPSDLKITAAPPWNAFPVYNADDETSTGFPAPVKALSDAIRAADGVVIVSPEYNYGLPGGLKNAIDWISRVDNQPFKGKPVAFQSASPGALGGARAQYQWRQVMVFLEARVFTRPEVFVTGATRKFDDKLELTDDATIEAIRKNLAGFETFVRQASGK
jgi:chromate reductase, NAD(P)H dehydrogenase (quinone)